MSELTHKFDAQVPYIRSRLLEIPCPLGPSQFLRRPVGAFLLNQLLYFCVAFTAPLRQRAFPPISRGGVVAAVVVLHFPSIFSAVSSLLQSLCLTYSLNCLWFTFVFWRYRSSTTPFYTLTITLSSALCNTLVVMMRSKESKTTRSILILVLSHSLFRCTSGSCSCGRCSEYHYSSWDP